MKAKTMFYCTECGNETPKWAGKCPACGAWNTIVEQPQAAKTAGKGASRPAAGGTLRRARPVTELEADEEIRFSTGMRELDRVLGGGAVNAGHEKKAAQVPSSVYLMKEITAPGVLVECGFLSNAAETEQLKDPAYQTKLAAAIAAGVLNSDKR